MSGDKLPVKTVITANDVNYQIDTSNPLGKGGFGTVYKALNLETGDFVAIKQVKLGNIPKDQLNSIMLEIDLLKRLKHPNIVRYIGYSRSKEYLNIILEFIESGSLLSVLKKFGQFPESLTGIYTFQVLIGLEYLHEQGVIHRDIKGANILTTKEGHIKLADFGIATKAGDTSAQSSVVGTPYWMAPEVIEMTGSTTKSDIWSVGCTVIELLQGNPPYYDLQPLPAMFRIVQDDAPPLPPGLTGVVQDFLMQCFIKEPQRRVSASKLLLHQWIASSKKKKEQSAANAAMVVALESAGASSVSSAVAASASASIPAAPAEKEDDDADWGDDFDVKDNAPISAATPARTTAPAASPSDSGAWDVSDSQSKPVAEPQSSPATSTPGSSSTTTSSPRTIASPKSPMKPLQTSQKAVTPAATAVSKPTRPPSVTMAAAPAKKPIQPLVIASKGSPVNTSSASPVKTMAIPTNNRPQLSVPGKSSSSSTSGSGMRTSSPADRAALSKWKEEPDSNDTDFDTDGLDDDTDDTMEENAPAGGRMRTATARSQLQAQRLQRNLGKWRERDDEWGDVEANVSGAPLALKPRASTAAPAGTGPQNSTAVSSTSTQKFTTMSVAPQSSAGGTSSADSSDTEADPFQFVMMDEAANERVQAQRDAFNRVATEIKKRVDQLQAVPHVADEVCQELSDDLVKLFKEHPDQRSHFVSRHGALPLIQPLLSASTSSLRPLLKLFNVVVEDDVQIQEAVCLLGAIPLIIRYASNIHPKPIRVEAARFLRQLCASSGSTLQMVIACRGLATLVDLLAADYSDSKDLVCFAIDAIHSVLHLQSHVPKNEFARIFTSYQLPLQLSIALTCVMTDLEGGEYTDKVIEIFLVLSRSDVVVKKAVTAVPVLKRVLGCCDRLAVPQCAKLLKCVKYLSAESAVLASLQAAGAVKRCVSLLRKEWEISQHILPILYNLCRLDRRRQEEAARAGLVAELLPFAQPEAQLKQLALPILCDLAGVPAAREALWSHQMLPFYVSLFADPYFQVPALEALTVWCADDTSGRVEGALYQDSTIAALLQLFAAANTQTSLTPMLHAFNRLLSASSKLNHALVSKGLVSKLLEKLRITQLPAETRIDLLKFLKMLFESAAAKKEFVSRHALTAALEPLSKDKAVLVQELASQLTAQFGKL